MAVRPEHHRRGVGRQLVLEVERRLRSEGVAYLQVTTLSAGAGDEGYLGTLAFYRSVGFRVLEEMPMLWGPRQPAVLLVMRF
jgi:ribosomal protein S18 acetylase RimI-like enzyme